MKNKRQNNKTGEVLNGYRIGKEIGRGGNGNVYEALNNVGETFAIKFLATKQINSRGIRNFDKKYKRFKDEIHVVKQHQSHIKGIVPIGDSYLPVNPSKDDRPWYAMPIAKPIKECADRLNSVSAIINCILDLSAVLIELHKLGIVHRDIKPENLYYYENNWSFGDFGLVEYPQKTNITEDGESVGPRDTIAPEMKRDAINADGKPADVYSLAKTLWILLTGITKSFDGQYSYKITEFSLDNLLKFSDDSPFYLGKPFVVTLHQLLEKSTSNNPLERPTAEEFHSTLVEWLNIKDDSSRRNILEWEFYIRHIIPTTLPTVISWNRPEDICYVLNTISQSNLNHMFIPSGGGNDLQGCSMSTEPGFVELKAGASIIKLKPKKLTLNTFSYSFIWNYFYLETFDVKDPFFKSQYPLADNEDEEMLKFLKRQSLKVEVIETSIGNYIQDNSLNNNINERALTLQLGGSFVFFAKRSPYNLNSSTYDARHNNYSAEEFRSYIQSNIDSLIYYEKNPDIYKKHILQEQKRKEELQRKERETFELKMKEFEILWQESLTSISFDKIPNEINLNSKAGYYLTISTSHNDSSYYLAADQSFVSYSESWFDKALSSDNRRKAFLFTNPDTVNLYIAQLKNHFSELYEYIKNSSSLYFEVMFRIEGFQMKRPSKVITRDALKLVIKDLNSEKNLAITCDGQVISLNRSDSRSYLRGFYPVCNIQSELEYIEEFSFEFENLYLSMLAGWVRYFRNGCSEIISDADLEVESDYEEKELLKELSNLLSIYFE